MSTTSLRAALSSAGLQPHFWTRLRKALGRFGSTLDTESLPDDLKRDLGLMSGRAAPPRDPLRD